MSNSDSPSISASAHKTWVAAILPQDDFLSRRIEREDSNFPFAHVVFQLLATDVCNEGTSEVNHDLGSGDTSSRQLAIRSGLETPDATWSLVLRVVYRWMESACLSWRRPANSHSYRFHRQMACLPLPYPLRRPSLSAYFGLPINCCFPRSNHESL